MKMMVIVWLGMLIAAPSTGQGGVRQFSNTFNASIVTARWQGALRGIGNWAAHSHLEGAARYRLLRSIDSARPNPDELAVLSPLVQALMENQTEPADFERIPIGTEQEKSLLEKLDLATARASQRTDAALESGSLFSQDLDHDAAVSSARQLQLLRDSGLYPQAQVSIDKVRARISTVLGELVSASIDRRMEADDKGAPAMIGESRTIADARQFVGRYAPLDCPVLITGETGVGKEILARRLHHYGGERAKNNFEAINVAAIPGELLESTLFGARAHSFTGAARVDAVGVFERNKGGTVFLDEIGDMSMLMQTKLLRFLQDGSIQPVGGTARILADSPRIIAATHRDLRAMISEEHPRFREDLYYRLNIIPFHLAALRDRPEDIIPLAQFFIQFYQASISMNLRSILSKEAAAALVAYRWPGNVRELESSIRRAIAQARGFGVIQKIHLGIDGASQELVFPIIEAMSATAVHDAVGVAIPSDWHAPRTNGHSHEHVAGIATGTPPPVQT